MYQSGNDDRIKGGCSQAEQNRRQFFSRVITVIQSVIGATLGVVLGGAVISPAFARRQEDWLPAATLGELPPNEPTPVIVRVPRRDGYSEIIDRRTVFLVRTGESQVTAIDSTCTHLGCRVSWDRDHEELRCPCHGGRYDRTGSVKSGPPPAPLATFATRLDGDRVLVQI